MSLNQFLILILPPMTPNQMRMKRIISYRTGRLVLMKNLVLKTMRKKERLIK